MSVFASKLNTNTDAFETNRQDMLALMDDYYDIKARAVVVEVADQLVVAFAALDEVVAVTANQVFRLAGEDDPPAGGVAVLELAGPAALILVGS